MSKVTITIHERNDKRRQRLLDAMRDPEATWRISRNPADEFPLDDECEFILTISKPPPPAPSPPEKPAKLGLSLFFLTWLLLMSLILTQC